MRQQKQGQSILASQQQQLGVLSKTLSSRAVARIPDFFFDHKEFDYSPAEIAEKTGLSFKTIFRELPTLERYQLICISRKIGKTNMYRLNTELNAVGHLERFLLRDVSDSNNQQ